jgi:hypothetical protein
MACLAVALAHETWAVPLVRVPPHLLFYGYWSLEEIYAGTPLTGAEPEPGA